MRVTQRLADVLEILARRLEGRLAIVSGRPAHEVAALAGTNSLLVAGSHGMEIVWPDGRSEAAARPAALDRLRQLLAAFAFDWPGLLVEEKPLGTAIHYRQVPAAAEASHSLAARLAAEHGLHLQTGKMMVELRAGGGDKGTALRRLLADGPMQGTRPVFLGDDDTDEPALAAAGELGGAGILVGPPRPTAAAYRLDGPAGVLDWLETEARL